MYCQFGIYSSTFSCLRALLDYKHLHSGQDPLIHNSIMMAVDRREIGRMDTVQMGAVRLVEDQRLIIRKRMCSIIMEAIWADWISRKTLTSSIHPISMVLESRAVKTFNRL